MERPLSLATTLVSGIVPAPFSVQAAALPEGPLGANIEGFRYPCPVHWFETRSRDVAVRMACPDVAPTRAAERQGRGADARQEALRGEVGRHRARSPPAATG